MFPKTTKNNLVSKPPRAQTAKVGGLGAKRNQSEANLNHTMKNKLQPLNNSHANLPKPILNNKSESYKFLLGNSNKNGRKED